jgi:hypothetical protein
MRKICGLLLALILLLPSPILVNASTSDFISVVIDGKTQQFDTAPVNVNG